jgi:uncharacterized protein
MKVAALTLALALLGSTGPTTREVSFTSADGSVLAGTLSWPAEANAGARVPAFVLVGGSGMNDRDERVGPNKTFAELAQQLNDAGFAVLRYDKRGAGASTSKTFILSVTRQNYVDDVRAAVAAAAADPHVDPARIYLLGHSEGGETVLGAALAGAPVRGIVMLAPLPIPYAAILKEQINHQHLSDADLTTVQKAMQVNHVFLDSYAGIDPRVEVTQVVEPMLLLHGSKDFQVTDADLVEFIAAAKASKRAFTFVQLDGDNHLFATLPAALPSTGAEYAEAHPLDPRVVADIVTWVRGLP